MVPRRRAPFIALVILAASCSAPKQPGGPRARVADVETRPRDGGADDTLPDDTSAPLDRESAVPGNREAASDSIAARVEARPAPTWCGDRAAFDLTFTNASTAPLDVPFETGGEQRFLGNTHLIVDKALGLGVGTQPPLGTAPGRLVLKPGETHTHRLRYAHKLSEAHWDVVLVLTWGTTRVELPMTFSLVAKAPGECFQVAE